MKSKRPALTPGLVAVKGAAAPAADMLARSSAPVSVPVATHPEAEGERKEELVPLNFRVAASFRREFKIYAASHDMKLNRLLRECFEAYRRTKGN